MSDKISLYAEILKVLQENNKGLDDILWIGTRTVIAESEKFLQEAKGIDYDNGYVSAEIPLDLIIVGKDWWLSVEEYDGRVWWQYNIYPQRPEKTGGGVKYEV